MQRYVARSVVLLENKQLVVVVIPFSDTFGEIFVEFSDTFVTPLLSSLSKLYPGYLCHSWIRHIDHLSFEMRRHFTS